MNRRAATPRGGAWATLAREMSPGEIFGAAGGAAMKSAWVPFPAPGGPTSTSLTQAPRSGRRCPLPLAQEPFIVALHELALDLLHRFQADADDDQDGGATEREVLLVAADQVDEQVGQHGDE